MKFEDYAAYVKKSWVLDDQIEDLIADPVKLRAFLRLSYATGKLNGESGEVIEEVQKALRDGDVTSRHEAKLDELGDVLWYVFAVAQELGVTIEDVMNYNVKKLDARRKAKRKAAAKR